MSKVDSFLSGTNLQVKINLQSTARKCRPRITLDRDRIFEKLGTTRTKIKAMKVYLSLLVFSLSALSNVFVMCSDLTGVTARAENEVWCRLNDGVSRCVGKQINKSRMPADVQHALGSKRWCPFRLCGPSYTQTDECASGDLAPIGICTLRKVRSTVYECRPNTQPKIVRESVACNEFGKKYCNMGPAFICVCKSDNKVQEIYSFKRVETPRCR